MNEKPRYPGIRLTANGNQLVSYHTETRITDAGIFYPITPSTEGGELYQQAYAEGKLNVFGLNTIAIEAEGEHRRPQGPTRRIAVDAPGKPDVELDDVGMEIEDVPEARVARPGVVDCESHPVRPELVGGFLEQLVVIDAVMFGQLEDDSFGRSLCDESTKLRGHHCVGRSVERQIQARGELPQLTEC